ncbi:MAG: grasp-with-spasm system SPASM domain peptide maturase [Saprospiraceae bacterium]|nr:grasp-with-spasm system SPASM domain peptide maturase [Saprospiraceae bacterium]MBP7679485.1 grasp-with-spasm system SPASM domain peptide maturase [Saprospiraceae bacterium]
MIDEKQPFILFSCCIPVKGHTKSLLCDVQRQEAMNIPNAMYEILEKHQGKSIEYIKSFYENNYDDIIDEYYRFLADNELVFFDNHPESFPKLSLDWETPYDITNIIIDFGGDEDIVLRTVAQMNIVRCKAFQIRCFNNISLQFIEQVLNGLEDNIIENIEIILRYQIENEHILLQDLVDKYKRIDRIIVYAAPDKYISHNSVECPIFYSKNTISEKNCGVIDESYFSVNIQTFTESQQYNTCLNRKISVDKDGYIKNCPSMSHHFGHIKDVQLADVIKQTAFTKFWNIKKDDIIKCKDCEFRHICTDCRAYLDEPDNIYSAPLKCGYDPYTGTWEDYSNNPLKQKAIQYYELSDIILPNN